MILRLDACRGVAALAPAMALALSACNPKQRAVLNEAANGANNSQIDNDVKAEARAVLDPLDPPAPGTPGGLPDEPTPVVEGAVDPESPQGAAQLVQGYYGLLEEKRFADAQKLWRDKSEYALESAPGFAARFAGFSEIHANIGAPRDAEGAAGSIYVTVPVQVYARAAATGKPYYALRVATLRRINDVDGSSENDRSWHIDSIGAFAPKAEAPPN